MYRDVLTDNDYSIAQANGVDRLLVYRRVNEHGWDIERAISEQVNEKHRPTGAWGCWKQIATENGVSHQLFRTRLSRGMTESEAAQTPPRKARGRAVVRETFNIPHFNYTAEYGVSVYG